MTAAQFTTYPMEQLSVKPSAIRVGPDLMLRITYGVSEQEMMAALLFVLCQEHDDTWWGFANSSLWQRTLAESRRPQTYFGNRPQDVFNEGLGGLYRRHMVRTEEHAGVGPVIYPTAELLVPVQRLIRR